MIVAAWHDRRAGDRLDTQQVARLSYVSAAL
jgi:hypothetical protein